MADTAAHDRHHEHEHNTPCESINGGSDFVEVTHDPLDAQRAVELVTHASAGAISTFIGTTRDNFAGKRVVRLEYEGYVPMAESELRKICVQIRSQWPSVVSVALFHRLGVVLVKEASVVIAVSSPHRTEALEACAFAIDTLKATVPIWKSEQYEGDSRMWKENAEWASGDEIRRTVGCCVPKRVMVPASSSEEGEQSNTGRQQLILSQTAAALPPRDRSPDVLQPQDATSSNSTKQRSLDIDDIVAKLIAAHDRVLGDRKVSARQLARLVQKLIDQMSQQEEEEGEPEERAAAPITAATAVLPQADYNRVSETRLKQVKMKMDLVFQQNFVRPGEDGYQYDKQVAFTPMQEASDWGDE